MAPLKPRPQLRLRGPLFRALALLGAALLLACPSSAQADREAVYSAIILNIARFVSWPPEAFTDARAPLVIGTIEQDPVNIALDHAAAHDLIHGRPVRTLRIRALEDLAECHVVFLSQTGPGQASILARVKDRPVLAIGDTPGFLELGGHVAFVNRSSRVALHVSPRHLKDSGLEARAQLLRLAEVARP